MNALFSVVQLKINLLTYLLFYDLDQQKQYFKLTSISIIGFKDLEGENVARHYSSQHQSRLYVFDTGGCQRRILYGKKESTQAENTLQAGKSSFNSNIRKQSQCDVLQETLSHGSMM